MDATASTALVGMRCCSRPVSTSRLWPAGLFGATSSRPACSLASELLTVQQGDLLGPLLFAAALQPLAAELRAGFLDIAVHYLDDGVLAGDLAAVRAALGLLPLRSP